MEPIFLKITIPHHAFDFNGRDEIEVPLDKALQAAKLGKVKGGSDEGRIDIDAEVVDAEQGLALIRKTLQELAVSPLTAILRFQHGPGTAVSRMFRVYEGPEINRVPLLEKIARKASSKAEHDEAKQALAAELKSQSAQATDQLEIKKRLEEANMLYGEEYARALAIYHAHEDACGEFELYRIGWIYHQDWPGVKQDLVKSHQYYLRAAEKGSDGGQQEAGINLVYGKGTAQDISKGLELLEKAAAAFPAWMRNVQCVIYYDVGLFYEQGEGVEKNLKTACEYYSKAASMGSKKGKDKLQKLEKQLAKVKLTEEAEIKKAP